MTAHGTRRIVIRGKPVDVDALCAGLVERMNDMGFVTFQSCQGYGADDGNVTFEAAPDLVGLLRDAAAGAMAASPHGSSVTVGDHFVSAPPRARQKRLHGILIVHVFGEGAREAVWRNLEERLGRPGVAG